VEHSATQTKSLVQASVTTKAMANSLLDRRRFLEIAPSV